MHCLKSFIVESPQVTTVVLVLSEKHGVNVNNTPTMIKIDDKTPQTPILAPMHAE